MSRTELVEIVLSDIETAAELHERLKGCLAFPAFYGQNWDAFWDAITGLVEMPTTLRLVGWKNLTAKLPQEASHMKACLDEMAIKYPEWASQVVYA
ncbi:MAG: barstar family protein [Pseudomonadota bacterium]